MKSSLLFVMMALVFLGGVACQPECKTQKQSQQEKEQQEVGRFLAEIKSLVEQQRWEEFLEHCHPLFRSEKKRIFSVNEADYIAHMLGVRYSSPNMDWIINGGSRGRFRMEYVQQIESISFDLGVEHKVRIGEGIQTNYIIPLQLNFKRDRSMKGEIQFRKGVEGKFLIL